MMKELSLKGLRKSRRGISLYEAIFAAGLLAFVCTSTLKSFIDLAFAVEQYDQMVTAYSQARTISEYLRSCATKNLNPMGGWKNWLSSIGAVPLSGPAITVSSKSLIYDVDGVDGPNIFNATLFEIDYPYNHRNQIHHVVYRGGFDS